MFCEDDECWAYEILPNIQHYHIKEREHYSEAISIPELQKLYQLKLGI